MMRVNGGRRVVCTEDLPHSGAVAQYVPLELKKDLPKGAQTSPSFWEWYDTALSPEGRKKINEAKNGSDLLWQVQRLYQVSVADYQRRRTGADAQTQPSGV